jgi:hypothetical protein
MQTLKEEWFAGWRGMTGEFLRAKGDGVAREFGEPDALDRYVGELRDASSPIQACIVLLELATFDLYWPLAQDVRSYNGISVDRSAQDRFLAEVAKKLGAPPERGRHLRATAFEAYRDLLGQGNLAASVISKSKAGPLAARLSSLSLAAFGMPLGLPGSTMMGTRIAEDGLGAIAPGGALEENGPGALLCGGAIFTLSAQDAGHRTRFIAADGLAIAAAKFEALIRELLGQKQYDRMGVYEALVAYSTIIQWIELQLIDELDRHEEMDYGALRRSLKVLRKGFDRCVAAFNR